MAVTSHAISDIGKARTTNEDSYFVDDEMGLFIVADGMGGQAAGEVASAMAVESIANFIRQTDIDTGATWPLRYDTALPHGHNRLKGACDIANQAVLDKAREDETKQGMGTTAVSALIEGPLLQLGHIGDSRAYLLSGFTLTQLTTDHTFVNSQVQIGLLTEEEAKVHPYRNIITRAIGAAPEAQIDYLERELKDGEMLLICSDGLTGMIEDAEIKEIMLKNYDDLEKTASELVDAANNNGGRDNITAVLVLYRQ